jgi:dynein light intermediate chain 1
MKKLREYALQFGASVIFTSVNENKNVELLYRYLLHRIYDFEFDINS